MIEKLQFISQENAQHTHLQGIEAACQAGVKWVQLRVKNKPLAEVKRLAEDAKSICLQWGARLIINDYPQIAQEVGADGFHLGKKDMPIQQAQRFAENMIIGQTANTFEDIRQHWQNGANYVGAGPFAFTTTKQKLSPILGLEGYRQLMQQCRRAGITIPVIAIGGIGLSDIPAIMQTGVHGIAVSSLIAGAENMRFTVASILQLLENSTTEHAYDRQ
ncbi:thiamine phosphate synthase [Cesiribacter sp. SM1]|uniref:thiamine phosphate synthase n=1 Tax=Cesiribacter sp. SM1 TaxID=2861196 RepID=UPI001CD2C120|nr:thiamine phosphate synthase [Cesiribacter sp. SM1]